MTDLQAWVNKKYPTQKERNGATRLYLSEPSLEGELDCSEFPNLWKILISHSLAHAKLTFLNQPEEIEIIKLKNAQVTFNQEFPQAGGCRGEFDHEQEICRDINGYWCAITEASIVRKELKNQGLTRAKIKEIEIDLFEAKLEGLLVITDFLQLVKIDLRANELTNLEFINCPQLRAVDCGYNQLTKLPKFFQAALLTTLDISGNQLTGSLDLSDFTNLEDLDCSYNQITKLRLDNCPYLMKLDCDHNQLEGTFKLVPSLKWFSCRRNWLTEIKLNNCHNLVSFDCSDNQLTDLTAVSQLVKLEYLNISYNQFSGSLAPLVKLVNLETLNINNNNFSGSLAPLHYLTKLKDLDDVSNTEINSGLEYLAAIEKFDFDSTQFPELEKYKEFNGRSYYLPRVTYRSWRTANQKLISNCLPIQPLSQQIQSLLALNKSFLIQEKAYEQMTRKIQAANYAQYCCLTIGATGAITGGYYSIPGGYLSGLAGFLGTFITYQLNEHWKAQLATLKQRSEGHQQASKAQFMTAVSQLEKSYHELVNLHTKLAVFDFTIISSSRTALRSLIEQFLSSFATLKEELEQQDSFRADLEIGWRTTTEARNYFEFFQQHWTQLAIKKVSSQLVSELTAYHAVLIKGTDSDSETEIASESDDFSDDLQQLFSTANN